ncbi:MAG: ferrochelatase [bacterium]
MKKPAAVMICNMGGPDSINAVRPFLFNLFMDPKIIPMPLNMFLRRMAASIISRRRAQSVGLKYSSIGGCSPINKIVESQAEKLNTILGQGYEVFAAMRYWHPLIINTVASIWKKGLGKIIAVPLYPHYSDVTTGTCAAEIERCCRQYPEIKLKIINNYFKHPGFIDAWEMNISLALQRYQNPDRVFILYCAHAVPQKLVEREDPYIDQINGTIKELCARFKNQWDIGYQGQVGPVKWYGISIKDKIKLLKARGISDFIIVPISFTAENLETMHELDVELKEFAIKNGLKKFHRVECLNDSDIFINGLSSIIRKDDA